MDIPNNQIIEILVRCERCNMMGLCSPRPDFDRINRGEMTQDTHDNIPLMWSCQTCMDTPAGYRSKNQDHKRLPDAEYQVDRRQFILERQKRL